MEDTDKIKEQIQAANQLLDEKNFSEAAKACEAIVVSGTETTEVNLALAELQYRLGKYDAAAKAYQAILDSGTTTAEVRRGLGKSLYRLWRYGEAIAEFKEAIKIDPDPDTYSYLGETFYQLRRFREAIENYEKAGALFLAQAEQAIAAANQCVSEEKKKEAKQKLADAQEAYGEYADSCIDIGYCYLCLRDYDKAKESLICAIQKAGQYPLAYHAVASVFWTQGNYKAAMKQWTIAKDRYKKCEEQMLDEDNEWTGWLMYEGTLLHEVFGNLSEAKRVYDLALAIDKNLIRGWAGLTALYVERQENCPKERNKAATCAQRAYKKAKDIIKSKNYSDVESLLMIGELDLLMEDYDSAETSLRMALQKDEEQKDDPRYMRSAKPNADLGILYLRINQCNRTNQYQEAIKYFQAALEIDSTDLALRSNLAEAYLRDDRLEDSEKEFGRVLKIAPDHIESRIGLAGVYTALGEAGDPDMYDAAVTEYTRALTLAATRSGSKRLTKSELAKVRYSRGYASVKSYEAFKAPSERGRLRDARADFAECFKLDEDQHKARRAVEKIDKVLPRRSPQRYLEDWGPSLILVLSFGVFLLFQWKVFNHAQPLPPSEYITVTLGSLLLMVASCYLPQLLKLKVPGIELEKTASVDQITTLGPVGISKPT
jgi:tetratricopeptide (TPR) repeat protein